MIEIKVRYPDGRGGMVAITRSRGVFKKPDVGIVSGALDSWRADIFPGLPSLGSRSATAQTREEAVAWTEAAMIELAEEEAAR